MPFLDGTEYRLLNKRTSAGGPIFWVADEARTTDDGFIYGILHAEMKHLSEPFKLGVMSVGDTARFRTERVSLPSGACEVQIDIMPTAHLAAAQKAEYRLLGERTPAGGLIFWVAEEAKARDNAFVNKMLEAESESMPEYWHVAVACSNGELKVKRIPSAAGGWEVHVDHCNADVRVGDDGKVRISGATLQWMKGVAQKVLDER